jgi:nitrate reductase NapAB chaperone NapD
MPICSYLVIPAPGWADAVTTELEGLGGCTVARADRHELIALVTDTPDAAEEAALRRALEGVAGIHALVLTFGDLDAGEEGA